MIPGRQLALVSPLVLLVDDDEPKPLKGRKKSRPGADHNVDISPGGPGQLVVPLSRRKPGIDDGDPVPEPAVEPHDRLIRQGDLRDQNDGLAALIQHMGDQLHVHLCLSAACDPVKEPRPGLPRIHGGLHRSRSPFLILVEDHRSLSRSISLHRVPAFFLGPDL